MTYLKAFLIAYKAHKGQKDNAGKPYISHPIAVAAKLPTKDMRIAGLLHDVCENSSITSVDLLLQGVPQHIVHSIELLTRSPQKPYDIYIQELSNDYIARKVKIADLEYNIDLNRIKDVKIVKKYQEAYTYLKYKDELNKELFNKGV